MRRRRFLIGLAALPVGWAAWSASRNRVLVANDTGQTIRWLTIKVCGESFRFADILPGGSVSAAFGTPRDESEFVVRGEFDDGMGFADSCGYVVWEDYGRRFRLVVRPGGAMSCTS